MNTEPKKYRLANPDGVEVTDENIELVLACSAAIRFTRAQAALQKMKDRFVETHLRGREDDCLKKELMREQEFWESAQKNLLLFVRNGTLAKTEFAHLVNEIEIIDWDPSENAALPAPKETMWVKVYQARRLAEKLRNELWTHVRKEGDPEKPTKKLPWEKP